MTSDNESISGLREIIAELNADRTAMLQQLKAINDFWNQPPTGAGMDKQRRANFEQIKSNLAAMIQPPTLQELAARGKKQRGNILPEILMLFAVLFGVATCGMHYTGKADRAVERYLNAMIEVQRER